MDWLKIVLVLLPCALLKTTTAVRTGEGRAFAIAFSQSRSDFDEGSCVVHINSKQGTSAVISEANGIPETVNILANQTFSRYYSYNQRVDSGIEDKGILIEADDNVTVMLSNYRNDGNMDTILVLPKNSEPQEYFVLSYPSTNDITCVGSATCSFYSVAAYEENTHVTVSKLENGQAILTESYTLEPYDIFTNRTQNADIERNYDFTGYFITADKPVSVTSGNPCADTNPSKVAGPVWASMPLNQDAGMRHISHTMNYNGYYDDSIVRVMALSDNTEVTYNGNTDTLSYRGQFRDYVINSAATEVFDCSKPCRAAQYSYNTAANVDGSGIFMTVLVPTNAYGTNVLFNKPDTPTSLITDRMSIIFLTESPMDDGLLYDGTVLGGWVVETGEGYSHLEIGIGGPREVAHSLISFQNIGFSAMIHGQGDEARGYGFIAGFGVADVPGSNITRPNPYYRVDMTGEFRSATGEDFTLSCTDSYSTEMGDVAASMVIEVNDRIGSTLCASHTVDDIKALSVSTPFLTNGNQGSTELRFTLAPELTRLTQDQVVACGDEVGVYLVNHDNWRNPILPILPGCPQVIFNSRMFNDSGKDWICHDTVADPTQGIPTKQQSMLKYGVRHIGFFATVDGSDLTPGCVADYNTGFDGSTYTQVQSVQGMITSGSVCGGSGVTIETATTNLAGQGNQGSSHQSYVLNVGDNSLAQDVYNCADELSSLLSPHSFWVQPIIPSVPDCPNVVFNPEFFTEESQEWLCI